MIIYKKVKFEMISSSILELTLPHKRVKQIIEILDNVSDVQTYLTTVLACIPGGALIFATQGFLFNSYYKSKIKSLKKEDKGNGVIVKVLYPNFFLNEKILEKALINTTKFKFKLFLSGYVCVSYKITTA